MRDEKKDKKKESQTDSLKDFLHVVLHLLLIHYLFSENIQIPLQTLFLWINDNNIHFAIYKMRLLDPRHKIYHPVHFEFSDK